MTTIQDARTDINTHLNGTGWFGHVNSGDIAKVAKDLEGLSSADANTLIAELAKSGKLDQLTSHANDGSWLGSSAISATDQRSFFADMAGKLDGTNLGLLAASLHKLDPNMSHGFAQVNELAAAVATHAGPQAKVDFIAALTPGLAHDSGHTDSYFGGSTTHWAGGQASAIGTVLSSLRGDWAAAGFAKLHDKQLQSVLYAATDPVTMSSTGLGSMGGVGGSANAYSTRPTVSSILAAAATIPSPAQADGSNPGAHQKATIFADAAATMRTIRNNDQIVGVSTAPGKDVALADIGKGMAAIIDSNPNAVVRDLAYNANTMSGSALATYAKQQLGTTEGQKVLGTQMAALASDNGHAKSIEFFTRPSTTPSGEARYANAGVMGYFAGAVAKGAESISSDVKAQQDLVTGVLKSALTIFDKSKTWGTVAGTAASVLKEWTSNAVRGAINDPGQSAAQQIAKGALPIDPKTNEIAVGTLSEAAFTSRFTAVITYAKP